MAKLKLLADRWFEMLENRTRTRSGDRFEYEYEYAKKVNHRVSSWKEQAIALEGGEPESEKLQAKWHSLQPESRSHRIVLGDREVNSRQMLITHCNAAFLSPSRFPSCSLPLKLRPPE